MLIWLNSYNAVGVNIATQTEKKKTKFVAKDTVNGLTRAATELKVVKIIITTKRKRGLKMPEYIKRADLLKTAKEFAQNFSSSCLATPHIIKAIEIAPKADVVEVVRCSECMHSTWEQEPCHGKTEYYCTKLESKVDTHFYCGCGIRKEGAEE